MQDRDHRDLVAGLLLALLGGTTALYAGSEYALGTLRRMGPGMVPMTLGVLLATGGLAIASAAWFRPGERVELRLLTPLILLSGIVAFALMIEPFGLLPAVFAAAAIATCAELELRPLRILGTGLTLCAVTWGVFILGLGLPMPAVAWPF